MNKVMKEMLTTGLYLLCVLCITYLIITFVGQRTEVEGGIYGDDPFRRRQSNCG